MLETINATEAARILGIHKETLYAWARTGKIECGRVGNRYRFNRRTIERYAAHDTISDPARAIVRGLQSLHPNGQYAPFFTEGVTILATGTDGGTLTIVIDECGEVFQLEHQPGGPA